MDFDKIPSTQTYALDMVARGNARNRTVIVAATQSAGRGRYRRTWVSHHGNLYTSFIYASPERDARLSYAVAVAVAETLMSFGVDVKIKWPNDIFIDGAKIAGILIEYAGDFVVVGIGINVKTCPAVDKYKTTKLNKYASVEIGDLLKRLMKKMDEWVGADFADVRARWTELAMALNDVVKYRGQSVELIGINECGALVLRQDSRYFFAYGDEIVMQ